MLEWFDYSIICVLIGSYEDYLLPVWICSENSGLQEEWTTSSCGVSILLVFKLGMLSRKQNVCISLTLSSYDSVVSASRAKLQLDGADIYAGCCTLKIEYARVSPLKS